jgi:hypothetical protein
MESALCIWQLCFGETNSQVIVQPLCDVFGIGEGSFHVIIEVWFKNFKEWMILQIVKRMGK